MPAFFAVSTVGVTVVAIENGGLPGWAQIVLAFAGFISIATKQLVPGWVYSELKDRLVQSEADNKRLTQTLLDTLPKATAAMEAGNRLVEDQAAELRARRRA